MKLRITRLIMVGAITALVLVAGSTAAWAQSCPTSPNYSPDFSNVANQACLTPNNNGADAGYPGFYTAVSGTGTVLRLTPNAFFTAGSAWYNTAQPVAAAFSTSFTFQLSGTTPGGDGNADGIAFVIQNSPSSPAPGALNALGPDGCGIGFGDSSSGCAPATGGITNSLAVEFNTYNNGTGVDPSNNDVTIQNCGGTGANSVDQSCSIAFNDLTQLNPPINMADGNVHTVTINYSGPSTTLLDVILDGVDLFPKTVANPSDGVLFDLTTIGLTSGNAYVGFTAATGGGDDNQDILSWTFTPGSQTAVVSLNAPAVLSFPNASGVTAYDFTGQLTQSYPTPVIQVQPILMTQAACDALVQVNFWPARCFVYENAENSGMDAAVMFAVTCPDSPGGTCGSAAEQNFFATLGTDFQFLQSENPFFTYPGVDLLLNPFPGFLKGVGPNPLLPCTPPSSGPLFQSNQVASFYIDNGHTNGNSGSTGSCWTATYDTPGEIWPGIRISSPTSTTYNLNQTVTANYTCSNPSTSQPLTSTTGPYLTMAPSLTGTACTQSTGTQTSCSYTPVVGPGNTGGLACTGTVNTSTKGLHTFVVTAIDSGGNQNLNAVVYTVK